MKIETINPMHVLYFSAETKINDLAQYVGVIGERLKKDAATQNLTITGDQCWMYYDYKGNPEQLFTLEIAFPIETLPDNYTGEFAVKTLAAFKCVTTIHKGHWLQIPDTYGKLMSYMQENNIVPTTNSRETYTVVDMENTENSITQIQLGIN